MQIQRQQFLKVNILISAFIPMPFLQLSPSYTHNSHLFNGLNRTTCRNINQSASGGRPKKLGNKCLQNNLIYAMCLPEEFRQQKMIKDENYFGRYGKVTTVIYTSKSLDSQPSTLQAYITYSNQKEAAIAIVAVNSIRHSCRVMRTTYGTNRMCNSFYTGEKCPVKNCFYLHDQKSCINIQGPLKTDFDKQKGMAQDIVKNNLVWFMPQIEELKQNQHKENSRNRRKEDIYFPSIQQAIKGLIQRKVIPISAYRQAYQQYVSSKKKMSSSVKKIQYIRYTKKLQSSNSFSQSNTLLSQVKTQLNDNQTQLYDYLDNKSTLHHQTKVIKNSFLMDPILISLNSLTQTKQLKSTNESTLLNQFFIVGKTQEPPSIYWQFLDQKNDCNSDQLQTEESQSELQHPDSFSISCSNSQMDSKRKYSSPEFPRDDYNILNRLKSQILRNPLIKKSRLQFAQTTSALEKKNQFQKVTILLRSSLIQ